MSFQLVPQETKPQPRANSAFKQLWSMHAVMATCYLLMFVGGFGMVKLPDNTPLQGNAYTLHKSIGVLTIGLLTWRISFGSDFGGVSIRAASPSLQVSGFARFYCTRQFICLC